MASFIVTVQAGVAGSPHTQNSRSTMDNGISLGPLDLGALRPLDLGPSDLRVLRPLRKQF